jgi:hypothetical protein
MNDITTITTDDGDCICLDTPGDMWGCPDHPRNTASKCGKCGQPAEDGIFVVVCRHVLEDDFDEDDEGERVPRIQVVTALPSKPGPTRHRCGDPWCPETELCAPCATNL